MTRPFKYYQELENKEYKVYRKTNSQYQYYDVPIVSDEEILEDLVEVLKKIPLIESLASGTSMSLYEKTAEFANLSNEEKMNYYEGMTIFESDKSDCDEKIKILSQKIDISLGEIIDLVDEYKMLLRDLAILNVFPEYQKEIEEIRKNIHKASVLYDRKSSIQIPTHKKCYDLFPYTWYFTPRGFLYNCNGLLVDFESSHNVGNMALSFKHIKECLTENREIQYNGLKSRKELIQKIINQGYVSVLDSRLYNNGENYMNLIGGSERKCYQKNLIQLVVGYYRAEMDFYQAFLKLNDSRKKKKIYNEIWENCQKSYNDMFIRFCGFSKVERCEKKITTASLYGIEEFREYLERGWDLYIVPRILYSKELDCIRSESYFERKYLEESLEHYDGKGRVLIRDINC